MTNEPDPPLLRTFDLPPLKTSLARTIARLLVILLFAYGVHLFVDWIMVRTEAVESEMGATLRIGVLAFVLIAYALMIAIPFMPGVEIGFSLILMSGAEFAPVVYLATVAGLIIAYSAGRCLPYAWLRRILLDLRLSGACRMLDVVGPLPAEERIALLRDRLPRGLGKLAVNYRYLLLAGLINLPGSAVIGGGGGISMVAGLTHLFRPRATVVTIVLAVLPLPLAVWLWGPGIFG